MQARSQWSRFTLTALIVAVAAVFAAPAGAQAQGGEGTMGVQDPARPVRSGYVEANGVDYYYAIYGKGEPLLLLHGGLGQIEMFGPALPELAQDRQVIGVDLHGHGRTRLGGRDIDLVDIGDDLAVLLDRLGYRQVDAIGYSFGGGAALRLAVQHPEQGAPPGPGLDPVCAGRLLPGDAAAAGAGGRADGRGDEGHADVPLLRGGGAGPG